MFGWFRCLDTDVYQAMRRLIMCLLSKHHSRIAQDQNKFWVKAKFNYSLQCEMHL